MKKFGQGFIVGVLVTILLTSGIVLAVDPIKLIVNGQEIKTDVAPQLISGRVMVPAKFVAEPLGATVQWDAQNNAVLISTSTDESFTDFPNPAATPEPKTSNIGETIEFSGTKIKVKKISYDDTHGTIVSNDNMKFALVNMKVWISEPPRNEITWAGNDFFCACYLADGREVSGSEFTTGDSMHLQENEWNDITVAIEIRESDELSAVLVVNPLNWQERAKVLF